LNAGGHERSDEQLQVPTPSSQLNSGRFWFGHMLVKACGEADHVSAEPRYPGDRLR
jgi:hypothetical protein